MSGLYGQPFDQFGVLILANTVTDPDSTITDPVIYRKGNVTYFRDTAGNVFPLVIGADGAGVVSITGPATYVLLPSDRALIIDSTAGAVSVTYPALGGPVLGRQVQIVDAKRQFATHNVTLNGNGKNIGAAATLVLGVNGGGAHTTWGGTTWEPEGPGVPGAAAPALHAPTHGKAGADPVALDASQISTGNAIVTTSPYVVLAADRVIPVDTTGGVISLTMPASGGAYVGQPLTVIDVARNFGTNTCTLNGNGHNVNGFGSQNLKSGETVYWTGTTWESNIAQPFAAGSITGPALQASGLLRYLTSLGKNGAGAVTLTGTKVGDEVLGVANITDHTNDASKFETTITVADQIQQSSATDLSAKTMTYLILARS